MVRTAAPARPGDNQRPAVEEDAPELALFSVPPVYSIVCGVLYCPLMLTHYNAMNARAEAVISNESWKRFGLLMGMDLLEMITTIYTGLAVGFALDDFRAPSKQPKNTVHPSPYSWLWGSLAGTIIVFPLSVLTWQLHTNNWRGWGSLLPFTRLGRLHWRALPAKYLDFLAMNVLKVWLAKAVSSMTGISYEPLGWLASDVKDHQEDPNFYDESEERSTASVIVDRARLWAIGVVSGWLSSLVLLGVEAPAVIVCHRMLGEPGRFGSVVECVRHIWASEGLSGFYRDLPLFSTLLGELL